MIITTVVTHSEKYFPSLVDSCKKNNYHLEILGWKQKWKGFTWKYQLMKTFLEELPEDEIVMFMDGFDAVILRPNIEEIFKSKNVDIFFGVEYAKSSLTKFISTTLFSSCKGYSLNSGMYIGYVHGIKNYLNNINIEKAYDDDQIILSNYCKDNLEIKNFDVNSEIFLNVTRDMKFWRESKIDIKQNEYFTITDGKIKNKDNEYFPCAIHFPGNTNFDDVVSLYQYDKRSTELHNTLYMYSRAKHFKNMFELEIYFMIIMLIIIFLWYKKYITFF